MAPRRSFDVRILWLLGAAAVCYAVGYPVALLGHSTWGWLLVFLGGPFLLGAGVLTIRHVHRGGSGRGTRRTTD